MAATTDTMRLSDLTQSLVQHRRTILVTALIGLLIGLVAAFALPRSYASTSSVVVSPIDVDSSVSAPATAPDMATELGNATSRDVAQEASRRLDRSVSASTISRSTTASSPDDSTILRFTVTSSTAARARSIADAYADAYLEVRRREAAQDVRDRLTSIGLSLQRLGSNETAASSAARSLGERRAALYAADTTPGTVITPAANPATRSTPGPLPLGVAGLALGLLLGTAVALLGRRPEGDPRIGGADRLDGLESKLVLDGTHDAQRSVTWDLAAFMLPIPQDRETPFVVLVDAGPQVRDQTAGQELVKALTRRGEPAMFVDAGSVNPGKISRGWPTERKRETWGSRVIVIDTSAVASQASKVEIATRVDMVVLGRSVDDNLRDLRRLARLLRSRDVTIDLTTIFPNAPELISLSV